MTDKKEYVTLDCDYCGKPQKFTLAAAFFMAGKKIKCDKCTIKAFIEDYGNLIAEGKVDTPIVNVPIYMIGEDRLCEMVENFAEKHKGKKGKLIWIEEE